MQIAISQPDKHTAKQFRSHHNSKRIACVLNTDSSCLFLFTTTPPALALCRTSWSELKTAALMTPHPTVVRTSISPAWLVVAAESVGLDVSPGTTCHLALLPLIIDFARLPIPLPWTLVDDASAPTESPASDGLAGQSDRQLRKSLDQLLDEAGSRRPTLVQKMSLDAVLGDYDDEDGFDDDESASHVAAEGTEPSEHEHQQMPRYMHMLSGEVVSVHPLSAQMKDILNGLRSRSMRSHRATSAGAWVQFADASCTSCYYYNMCTTKRLSMFPILPKDAVQTSLLPVRQLEPSSALVSAVAQQCWTKKSGDSLAAITRRELYEPRCAARAVALSHQPDPLDVIVRQGAYMNLDAARFPELMWLAELALTPLLPPGWVRCPDADSGKDFFWNAVCGSAQWEHPYSSFLNGVAARLLQEHAKELERLRPRLHSLTGRLSVARGASPVKKRRSALRNDLDTSTALTQALYV